MGRAIQDKRPLAWEIGAGVAASHDLAAWAGGLTSEMSLGRPHLAARITLEVPTPREAALGGRSVSWSRYAISIGGRYRLAAGPIAVEGLVAPVGALLVVEGHGFTMPRREYDFDPGLSVGTRILFKHRRVMPWFGASFTGWLRPQVVTAQDGRDVLSLPRFEGSLTVGVCLGNYESF